MDCLGWTVKCPDGMIRNFPYHNEGDAQFDAEQYTKKGRCGNGVGWDTPCPGGKHEAVPASFEHDAKE